MNNRWLILFIVLSAQTFFHPIFAQETQGNFKVLFYNVENLFDTEDDPKTTDEEFLPNGERHWNNKKLKSKLNKVSQVIIASGEGNLPAVIGLCEVENQQVLDLLLSETSLGKLGYKYIHKESPDERGIDVALLYHSDTFKPISYSTFPVTDDKDSSFKTRDILQVCGQIGGDTLQLFVNHWPSKYGGIVATKRHRNLAATTLRNAVDSVLASNNKVKLIVMGDFNDSPIDESITHFLKAQPPTNIIDNAELYNLAYSKSIEGLGSNKYQGKWELIDQIMVSGALLNASHGLRTSLNHFNIIDLPFLLEDDKTYLGKKPYRTYVGFKYHNGFSDHLPVVLKLEFTEP